MDIRRLQQLEKFCSDYRGILENSLSEFACEIGNDSLLSKISEKGLPDIIFISPEFHKKVKNKLNEFAIIRVTENLPKGTLIIFIWK